MATPSGIAIFGVQCDMSKKPGREVPDEERDRDKRLFEALIIGDNLRILRNELGLTQEELGDRVGIGQAGVSAMELGKRCPSIPALFAIAQACNVSPCRLLERRSSTGTDSRSSAGEPIALGALSRAEPEVADLVDAMTAIQCRDRVLVVAKRDGNASIYVDHAPDGEYPHVAEQGVVAVFTAADLVHLAARIARTASAQA